MSFLAHSLVLAFPLEVILSLSHTPSLCRRLSLSLTLTKTKATSSTLARSRSGYELARYDFRASLSSSARSEAAVTLGREAQKQRCMNNDFTTIQFPPLASSLWLAPAESDISQRPSKNNQHAATLQLVRRLTTSIHAEVIRSCQV